MKIPFRIPLWISVLGYLLFFVMIVGFTVFLPWIVPVSLIIGAIIIGLMAWGVHKEVLNWLTAILMGTVAAVFFFLAFRGFMVFVETHVSGKIFLLAGIIGLTIIFLGRQRKEIKEFERFIGFQTPLKGLQRNSRYLAGAVIDLEKLWSRIYHPKPKSKLNSKKRRKRLFKS
ncbi:MAG: hypothetical protein M0Z77_04995 [Thermoplasmatales archaeon]|jgi:hypothetical protein|nr:hypothetical protein [Candidatus Thermoplasmatota archaeon]MCL6003616.1 hypothetical protein [Candidatus Thermoplasmatota archaeon]MDA8054992.1 hypothetical protein [Thermoplasmatales archaeon]